MSKQHQTICIGIVQDIQGHFLICQRQSGQHLAGKWEFPGGKVDQGETLEQALVRELQEEVGITPSLLQSFESLDFDYDDLSLTLHFYLVRQFSGTATSCEGQQLKWVTGQELLQHPFPKANLAIINKLLERA